MTRSLIFSWCWTLSALLLNLAVLAWDIVAPDWKLLPMPLVGLALCGIAIYINIRTTRRLRS